MPANHALKPEPLSQTAFAPYGWLLGKPYPVTEGAVAFSNAATDFWHEHLFDAGVAGKTEILWVNYRSNDPAIGSLERHLLTDQAVVPLVGAITQIVALPAADGSPDLDSLRAFRVEPGMGVCMRANIWHATRSEGATCLMLTRRSTTVDLIAGLNGTAAMVETALQSITGVELGQ